MGTDDERNFLSANGQAVANYGIGQEVKKVMNALDIIIVNQNSTVYLLSCLRSVRELDRIVNLKIASGFGIDDLTEILLHRAYRAAFEASKLKGIMEGKSRAEDRAFSH